MPRLPRFVIPEQPQHVIIRGNNRAEIFCADADYSFYLEKLKLACDKQGYSVHACADDQLCASADNTNFEYLRLVASHEARLAAYHELFRHQLSENCMTEIREATHKDWELGNGHFKERIQSQLDRRDEPKARGGNRKSEQFKANQIKKLKEAIL